MNQEIDTSLQSQIHKQLMEQGAFTPLDLLLSNGRLGYADYERWRAGEIEFLDQAFLGSPKRIDTLLQQAIAFAQTIGLVSETQDFPCLNPGGQTAKLRMSADKTKHEQLSLRFVSKRDSPQLDMFFDNPVVVLTNNVVDALVHRSFTDAQHYLDKLYQQAPNHADLAAFDLLVDAVRLADKHVNDPPAELLKLEQLSPHAKRLLSNRSRDFLVPRALTVQLKKATNRNVPRHHNSKRVASRSTRTRQPAVAIASKNAPASTASPYASAPGVSATNHWIRKPATAKSAVPAFNQFGRCRTAGSSNRGQTVVAPRKANACPTVAVY